MPRPAGARRAGIRLALSLFPVVALSSASIAPETGWSRPRSRPYLTAVAAPPLRFAAPLPPPDLSVRPPAGGPLPPVETPEAAGVAAVQPGPDAAKAAATASVPEVDAAPAPAEVKPPTPPPSILPDDLRTKVRPEDFLPFFQFPGSGSNPNDVTVVMPAVPAPPVPGTQPPSSATYKQQ